MTDENNPNEILYIGKTNFRGQDKIFGIKHSDRFQHMYVIGQTGTGKTNLLKNTAIQDIEAGRGIAVVDPHGEFVEELLEMVPDNRLDDVIYFNPADQEYPMGFNPLEVRDPTHKHLVASGLMAIFTKIWANVWSARMEYILNNTILALVDTPNSTLLGIPRMLVDKIYRQTIVNNCKDPVVRSYWINEYEQYEPRFRSEAISPIQNKVGQFLGTSIIRNVVGQKRSSLDVEKAMDNGNIVLINVSKGKTGEDNSALLGAMIITKIQLAAMERVRVPIEQRRDFILYVDEFQNFATDSFAGILSEARKYKLGLVISHQYIGQLITESGNDKLRDAIFGNVGTTVTFRVGAQDAEFLETHYAPEILAQDLINLPNFNVYMKLLINGMSSRPFSATILPPIKVEVSPEHKKFIIDNSRKNYARPRIDVENEIAEWAGMRTAGAPTPPDPLRESRRVAEEIIKETDESKEEKAPQTVRPVPNMIIKPKYETDLGELGIDPGEEQIKYQEIRPEVPEPVSLSELQSSAGDPTRGKRRKRKKKRRPGGPGGADLRDVLNSALGMGSNMYPTVGQNQNQEQNQQPENKEPSAEGTSTEY
ncbi:MAG: type IV secretion system DNA-binding domain-containing protein [Parcubacteria group bacterium]